MASLVRPVTIFLALGLLAAPAALGAAGSRPVDPCGGFERIPFQGPSCPVEGGWEVLLPDGSRRRTHGPDPLVAAAGPGSPQIESSPPTAAQPTCAGPQEARHRVVYAHPSDRPDRFATQRAVLEAAVLKGHGLLRREAVAQSVTLTLAFECEHDGRLAIGRESLAIRTSDASYASIVAELTARGLQDPGTKYLVFFDGRVGGYGGQAEIPGDDEPGIANANNRGATFALVYETPHFETFLHEAAHGMGAVQLSAPHSTGAYHCFEAYDVLCYADGGALAALYPTPACANTVRFDCGNDDYFHASPIPGSYLATHWNLASSDNLFLRTTPECDVVARGLGLRNSRLPGFDVSDPIPVPAACAGLPYTLVAAPPGATFDIEWVGAERFDARPGDESGFVPAGAGFARIHGPSSNLGTWTLALG